MHLTRITIIFDIVVTKVQKKNSWRKQQSDLFKSAQLVSTSSHNKRQTEGTGFAPPLWLLPLGGHFHWASSRFAYRLVKFFRNYQYIIVIDPLPFIISNTRSALVCHFCRFVLSRGDLLITTLYVVLIAKLAMLIEF